MKFDGLFFLIAFDMLQSKVKTRSRHCEHACSNVITFNRSSAPDTEHIEALKYQQQLGHQPCPWARRWEFRLFIRQLNGQGKELYAPLERWGATTFFMIICSRDVAYNESEPRLSDFWHREMEISSDHIY